MSQSAVYSIGICSESSPALDAWVRADAHQRVLGSGRHQQRKLENMYCAHTNSIPDTGFSIRNLSLRMCSSVKGKCMIHVHICSVDVNPCGMWTTHASPTYTYTIASLSAMQVHEKWMCTRIIAIVEDECNACNGGLCRERRTPFDMNERNAAWSWAKLQMIEREREKDQKACMYTAVTRCSRHPSSNGFIHVPEVMTIGWWQSNWVDLIVWSQNRSRNQQDK